MELSTYLFDVMSCIGYSPNIVKERRKIFHEKDVIFSSRRHDVTLITGGSKGEGFSSCFESDYDRLSIYNDVICHFPEQSVEFPETTTCFHMIDTNCHPGHYTLTLWRRGTVNFPCIEAALVQDGQYFNCISSDLFTKELEKTANLDIDFGWNRGSRTGPAVTSSRGIYLRDDVYAFRCLSQRALLTDWSKRVRSYNWPPPKIIEEILKLDAHLVPVGCKGSANECNEWRICFIPGELKLCETWNETQYKLYILLKMINKHTLRPICPDLSSYMMKNVTFWICENNSDFIFTRENLLLLLKMSLQMLMMSLKNKCLSYYMIAERNLFTGRQCLKLVEPLVNKLEEILSDISKVVKNLPKVQKALSGVTSEGQLIARGMERDVLESLELKRQYIIATYTYRGMTRVEIDSQCWENKLYRDGRYQMYDMVWPNWKQYFNTTKAPGQLESLISSMNGPQKFPDQYRRFARSYYDIIWPHIQKLVERADEATEDEIIDFLAILRIKVEIALS